MRGGSTRRQKPAFKRPDAVRAGPCVRPTNKRLPSNPCTTDQIDSTNDVLDWTPSNAKANAQRSATTKHTRGRGQKGSHTRGKGGMACAFLKRKKPEAAPEYDDVNCPYEIKPSELFRLNEVRCFGGEGGGGMIASAGASPRISPWSPLPPGFEATSLMHQSGTELRNITSPIRGSTGSCNADLAFLRSNLASPYFL